MIPLRNKPYGGAWGIKDEESVKHLASIKTELGDRKKFLTDYKEWFTRDRAFEGIGGFQNIDFSAGTTETFDYFYLQHMDRRLRLYKAEYFYHWVMARNYFKKSAELGAEPLTEGDVVVMSCPFSGTGKIPKDFYKIQLYIMVASNSAVLLGLRTLEPSARPPPLPPSFALSHSSLIGCMPRRHAGPLVDVVSLLSCL